MAFNIDNIFNQKTVTLNFNNITQHCSFYCIFIKYTQPWRDFIPAPNIMVCLSFTAVSPSLPFRWRPLQASWLWTGTDSPPSSLKILNSSTRVSTTTDRSFSRTYNTNIPFSMLITYILIQITQWRHPEVAMFVLCFYITLLSFYIVTAFFILVSSTCYQTTPTPQMQYINQTVMDVFGCCCSTPCGWLFGVNH